MHNSRTDNTVEELDDDLKPSKKMYFQRTYPVRQHSFYLYSGIGEPSEYTEMIHTIRTAEPHDQIYIYLNSEGGHLDTGISLISAINETQATVTMVLDSTACSMAAILFLAGHQYIVHDFSMLMFHTFSGGVIGKSSDIDKQLQAYRRQFSLLMKKVCGKFLTADELRRLDNGEELWFSSEAIAKRLRTIGPDEAASKPAAQKRKKPIKDVVIEE